jgi:tetratricopeptide (TPR) repeat protein
MSQDIEALIEAEDWNQARRVIKSKLRAKSSDHWLLSRLALTYYEQREYSRALEYELEALKEVPACPLALWGYAGSLEMLGQEEDAAKVYRRLIQRGANRMAFGDCGEGLAWARGLVADCYYRLAYCYDSLHKRAEALRCLRKHISLRGPGCRSIYALTKVRKEIDALQESRSFAQ